MKVERSSGSSVQWLAAVLADTDPGRAEALAEEALAEARRMEMTRVAQDVLARLGASRGHRTRTPA